MGSEWEAAPIVRTDRHLLFLLHLRVPVLIPVPHPMACPWFAHGSLWRPACSPAAPITSIYTVYAYNVIGRVAMADVGVLATSSARPFTGTNIFHRVAKNFNSIFMSLSGSISIKSPRPSVYARSLIIPVLNILIYRVRVKKPGGVTCRVTSRRYFLLLE